MSSKNRPAAKQAKSSEPKAGKKSVIKSSSVNYLDASTDHGKQAFLKYVKLVAVGSVLVTPAIDKDGFVLGEVVLQILDTVVHQSGLYVQAKVAAWSNSSAKNEMKFLHGKDCLAHLCKSMGSCKSSIDDDKVVHIREWKVLDPAALDEKYITPDQRRALTKKTKTSSGKTVTEADDDDEEDDDDDDEEETKKGKQKQNNKIR